MPVGFLGCVTSSGEQIETQGGMAATEDQMGQEGREGSSLTLFTCVEGRWLTRDGSLVPVGFLVMCGFIWGADINQDGMAATVDQMGQEGREALL